MARIWDVFRRKEGAVGFSPRVLTLGVQFGHLESSVRGCLCPEGGYRTQPRVSTLGTLEINELTLTRRYPVAPSVKNTRSSGLEMLKGREADQINLAPVAAQKLEYAIKTCTI
jgi:hypothetical protein